MKKHEAGKNT